ncbi:unnamed protein product [Amoebophrya sp. A120]|nr:unnamed protein product [Amoebophrya sp. A120]|eukprot:GSA120T00008405001.1
MWSASSCTSLSIKQKAQLQQERVGQTMTTGDQTTSCSLAPVRQHVGANKAGGEEEETTCNRTTNAPGRGFNIQQEHQPALFQLSDFYLVLERDDEQGNDGTVENYQLQNQSQDNSINFCRRSSSSSCRPWPLLNEAKLAEFFFVDILNRTKPYHLFYGGPFSNWHRQQGVFYVEKQAYNCGEQYLMAEKAKLFQDFGTRKKILQAAHPKEQKQLGRKVRNFDEAVWTKHRLGILLAGLRQKFSPAQNPEMSNYLLQTKKKLLVEASPVDTIWGVGLSEHDDSALDKNAWLGKNLLGLALMIVREELNTTTLTLQ